MTWVSRELVFLILQFLDEEGFKKTVHSLNWQHQLCKNPRPDPDIKTLFMDHACGPPNGARAPSPMTNPLMNAAVPKPGGLPPLGAHGPFQPDPAPLPAPLPGWMANPSPVAHPAASTGPMGLVAPNNAAPTHLLLPIS